MGYVLITGASEGIGKAIARRAAQDGSDLILTARSEDKLEALASELRDANGVDVKVIAGDLNGYMAEKCRLYPGRVSGMATVFPGEENAGTILPEAQVAAGFASG